MLTVVRFFFKTLKKLLQSLLVSLVSSEKSVTVPNLFLLPTKCLSLLFYRFFLFHRVYFKLLFFSFLSFLYENQIITIFQALVPTIALYRFTKLSLKIAVSFVTCSSIKSRTLPKACSKV